MKLSNERGISAIGLVIMVSVVFAILIASSAQSAHRYFETYRKMRIRLDAEQLVEDLAIELRKEYERLSIVSFPDDPNFPHKNPNTLKDFTSALKSGSLKIVIENPNSAYYKKQIQIDPNLVETFNVVDLRWDPHLHTPFDREFFEYASFDLSRKLKSIFVSTAHADMTDSAMPVLPSTLPTVTIQYDNTAPDNFDKRYFFRCNEGNQWLEYDCITIRLCAKPTTTSCASSELITASYAFFRTPKTSLDN